MTRLSKRNDIPEKERNYQSYFLLHDNDFMGHYYFRLNVCVYVCMCTWKEEPCRLQSMESQRLRHDLATKSNKIPLLKCLLLNKSCNINGFFSPENLKQ